jgi:signal transduction histidine kinase
VFRFRSVLGRTIALHVIAIVVTSIFMPLALYFMLKSSADVLHERALTEQALEIARYLIPGPDGKLQLDLPRPLAELYSETYGRYSYAVVNESGDVLFSSFRNHRAIDGALRPPAGPVYFTRRLGQVDIHAVSEPIDLSGEQLWIQISQDLAHRDVLIDDIVADFFTRVGWVTVPILLLLLMIDVAIFRRVIKPIVAASDLAERISPAHTELRLPEADIPQEILPLVRAVNAALDRLEEGFRAQRDFTADAAHELRTPLTILRTQIDMIGDRDLAESLRNDVESMSRLVNQLLEISELDTFEIGADEVADLAAVSTDVAAYLAPIALARSKTLAVGGDGGPVRVRGNADAIGRAVRNLVENALAHTPPGTTVEIDVAADGTLRVKDRGPGVPIGDRELIFRRFWRRDRRRSGSSGLGLSIVARIAEMHGATVLVADNPGGGAMFTVRFPQVLSPVPAPRRALDPVA